MLLHLDNWSLYGTDSSLPAQGVYAVFSTGITGTTIIENDPDGISSGKVVHLAWSSNFRYVLPSYQYAAGQCVRVWFTNLPSTGTNDATHVLRIFDSLARELAAVNIDNTGRIRVLNAAGTQVAITANPVLTSKGWWHIEAKYVTSNTNTFDVEIRVEGVPVLTLTTLANTLPGPVASVGCAWTSGSEGGYYVKDYCVWDTTGSHNNDFIGTVIVQNIAPDADISLNWTPSVVSEGWSILDNSPPNDSQYISAPYPGIPAPYVCTLSELADSANISSIKGVKTFVRAKKSDGGDGGLQVSLVSNGQSANGTDRPITQALTYWTDVFETDPNTGNPWTVMAVNNVNLKLNRTL